MRDQAAKGNFLGFGDDDEECAILGIYVVLLAVVPQIATGDDPLAMSLDVLVTRAFSYIPLYFCGFSMGALVSARDGL